MKGRALIPPARSLLTGGPRTSTAHGFQSFSFAPTRTSLAGSPLVQHSSRLIGVRYTSAASGSSAASDAEISSKVPETALEEPGDGEEKPVETDRAKRTRRITRIVEAEREVSTPLPAGLDILWTPGDTASSYSVESTSSSSDTNPVSPPHSHLPPPELFTDILNKLLITLHPHTQHRATYSSAIGSPVEPTLALYCPIEGGDYILDATIWELARRTGSDVVVLDAVQLAAGEWGMFGKAANALYLPQNPLHFQASSSRSDRFQNREQDPWDDMELTGRMTVHITAHSLPTPTSSGKSSVLAPPRRSSASKVKVFFDDLVSVSSATTEESAVRRPRLVYIRDCPTLAPSASLWYAPLLAAVRQRRQGPVSRPTSPISNPMTIIFGITPPIVPSPSSPSDTGPQGILGLTINRQSSALMSNPAAKSSNAGNAYGEDEQADKSRERRLRDRLRKWERDDPSFWDEVPKLSRGNGSGEGSQEGMNGIVAVGAADMAGFPMSLPQALASSFQNEAQGAPSGPGDADASGKSHFFRTSVVVPMTRSVSHEKDCRMARRRELNELTMRMGVGAVGGSLKQSPHDFTSHVPTTAHDQSTSCEGRDIDDFNKMWTEWGKHVEIWSVVKSIADRVVGNVVASDSSTASILSFLSPNKSTLEPTPINWDSVVTAWTAHRAAGNIKRAWLTETTGKSTKENATDDEDESKHLKSGVNGLVDELVQQVKSDPDLTPHESRLLGSIIDAASMPTSFSHVHLPPHTIDSVRTIVSLPLLHPSAFQQGILKDHGMTGCLLFGPPGTGKTLVVRALAKEAGCRMLAIAPSDVMDMYVGEGEKLVRSVFSLARRLSPCVVFLDEIDALFGARTSSRESGSTVAHRGVITEFMQEMDGLKSNKGTNVIVIGATNRPFDLDDAVLRRLPRRLLVDLPGEAERAEILKILLRDERLGEDVDIHHLGKRTELFSGSDLKHLCVSAALDAVKEGVALPWNVPLAEKPGQSVNDATVDAEATEAASAIDAIAVPSDPSEESTAEAEQAPSSIASEETVPNNSGPRTLHLRHFKKALREITPSSSESLGSLSALRNWNEEFGEGQTKKRKIMWGKGSFGFAEPGQDKIPDGRVSSQERTDNVDG